MERHEFFSCGKRSSCNSICLLEPLQRPAVNRWAAWAFSFDLSPGLHRKILLLSRGQSIQPSHISRAALIVLPSFAWQSLFFPDPCEEGMVPCSILQIPRGAVLKARQELWIIQPNTEWDISLISILCAWLISSFLIASHHQAMETLSRAWCFWINLLENSLISNQCISSWKSLKYKGQRWKFQVSGCQCVREEDGPNSSIDLSAGKLWDGLQRGQKSSHGTLTALVTLETHSKQIPKSMGGTSLARTKYCWWDQCFPRPGGLVGSGSTRLLQAFCQQLEFLHHSGFVEAFSALSFWHFSFAGFARQRWHNVL